MRTYRVMFFKTLTNSYGKVFEVCQRTIEVSSARNADHAVKQAKRRFEQCENINDWRLHADYFQIDTLPAPLDAIRATECRTPASDQSPQSVSAPAYGCDHPDHQWCPNLPDRQSNR